MPCTSHDGDATKVVSKLDMPRVVEYGRQKGVGIWVYVNQHALMKQAAELFPLLHEWGIVGVKSGFVQYASHRWATWVHDLVRLAAENHLLMNIHDEFRPSGFSRTYPNLLTQKTRTQVLCSSRQVKAGEKLKFRLLPSGGAAVRFEMEQNHSNT